MVMVVVVVIVVVVVFVMVVVMTGKVTAGVDQKTSEDVQSTCTTAINPKR